MFLDIHELALHRIPIRKSYLPGGLDFHSTEFKQVEPLVVRATAELVEGQIRVELRALPRVGARGSEP